MSDARGLTYGLAIGAGLMFLFDPRRGAARRALIRDKSMRTVHEVEDAIDTGTRDLSHRIEGTVARLMRARSHEPVSDDVLVARVRTRLGHVCSFPHALEVTAKGGGCIELKGPVLSAEVDRVLGAASHVPGVTGIDDDLEPHDRPGDVPGLQGAPVRTQPISRYWNPSTRLALGLGAAGFAVSSLLAGRPFGLLAGGAGVIALARSMEQRHLRFRRGRGQNVLPKGSTGPRVEAQLEPQQEPKTNGGIRSGAV